jgi:hypothetical protein
MVKLPLDRIFVLWYNLFESKREELVMTNTTGSEVLTTEESIANWLEYGMDLPVTEPFAKALAPVCVKAIEAVNNHDLKTLIELPKGITITWLSSNETTNLCPAYAIVYRFQLDQWLNKEWF